MTTSGFATMPSRTGQAVDPGTAAADVIRTLTSLDALQNLDVHQVMIAAQEASVSLNLALQVRNKLVDAYQEIQRVNM